MEGAEVQDVAPLVPEPSVPKIQRPCYRVYDTEAKSSTKAYRAGTWHHTYRTVDTEKKPLDVWLCGPLHVAALTRSEDESTDYGLLLRLKNLDGRWVEVPVSRTLLAGKFDQILALLYDAGLAINFRTRQEIVRYIATQVPVERLISAVSTGWQNQQLFVLPTQKFGSGEVVFQAQTGGESGYKQGGSLEGWQREIGHFCEGNPILQLAVCASLAGPLLYHVPRNGAGFHLVGDSSTGKSTAMLAAASLWGAGSEYIRTWRATGNGLEGLAALRSDTLLVLDEIGEASAKEVGSVVYALANGVGKLRASRTGAARRSARWRVMLLSSGEVGLATLMRDSGQKPREGQQLRLLDIPVRRSFGAWDLLHGLENGRLFSNHIQRASAENYGHAGPAFTQRLLDSDHLQNIPALLSQEVEHFSARDGQEARAAEVFALTAVAGELAVELGILPICAGEPRKAMLELFDLWRSERGKGCGEDRKILQGISNFLAQHSDSRFSSLRELGQVVRERAGYWDELPSGNRVYLLNRPALEEAAGGYEVSRIVAALRTAGVIFKSDAGRHQATVRVPSGENQKFYVLDPSKLETDESGGGTGGTGEALSQQA